MSISSISINPRIASAGDDGWQHFAQLVRAVNGGNLTAAQKAFDKFSQSPAGSLAESHPNSRIAQAMGKIGDALQAGDIGKAQQALAVIKQRPQGETPPPVVAPSISPAEPNAPGGLLDLTI